MPQAQTGPCTTTSGPQLQTFQVTFCHPNRLSFPSVSLIDARPLAHAYVAILNAFEAAVRCLSPPGCGINNGASVSDHGRLPETLRRLEV